MGAPTASDGPRADAAAPVLVLCLGNRIRKDDAVALHVADALEALAAARTLASLSVRRSARAGLYLLDDMEGFDRVVVVDAVRTGAAPVGTVHSVPLEAIHSPGGPSPHAIGLPSALELARAAGAPVPGRIHVVAIEVEDMESVGEGLTPAVAAAVPAAVAAVEAAARALAATRSTPA